jgi:hypothetical protein
MGEGVIAARSAHFALRVGQRGAPGGAGRASLWDSLCICRWATCTGSTVRTLCFVSMARGAGAEVLRDGADGTRCTEKSASRTHVECLNGGSAQTEDTFLLSGKARPLLDASAGYRGAQATAGAGVGTDRKDGLPPLIRLVFVGTQHQIVAVGRHCAFVHSFARTNAPQVRGCPEQGCVTTGGEFRRGRIPKVDYSL